MQLSRTQPAIGARLLTALAGAVAAAALLGIGTARALDSTEPQTVAVIILTEVYAAVGIALITGFGRARVYRDEVLALRPVSRRTLACAVLAWVAAYGVAAAGYLASTTVGLDGGEIIDVLLWVGADGGRLATASPALTAMILLRVCVLVPVAEELLFRGALYSWLRNRVPAAAAIPITGVLFGLMHQVTVFIPLAVVVGIAAGYIRERTGSVVPTLVVHAFQNAVIVAASLLATGWDPTWSVR